MKSSLYSDIFSNTRDPKFLPTWRDLKIFNLHILEGLIMFTDHLDHWVFTSFFHFHMIWLYQKHCIQTPKLKFSAGKRKKNLGVSEQPQSRPFCDSIFPCKAYLAPCIQWFRIGKLSKCQSSWTFRFSLGLEHKSLAQEDIWATNNKFSLNPAFSLLWIPKNVLPPQLRNNSVQGRWETPAQAAKPGLCGIRLVSVMCWQWLRRELGYWLTLGKTSMILN